MPLRIQDKSEVGMISTFTISADGTSITEVASLEHDGSGNQGTSNSLVQVDSDTYALAYTGGGKDGFISTFTIDGDGNITAVKTESEGNNLEHDTGGGAHNSLIQVDSDTYVLAYQGGDFDGWISTFTISSDGATITEVATLEFYEADSDDTGNNDMVEGNSLVQVDADTYALTYGVQVGLYEHYGYITTFTIPTDGSSITQVASFKHSLSNGEWNSIVKVDADTYLNAYMGSGADGFIKTFTIQSDGSMGSTAISGDAGFRMLSSPLAGQVYSDLLDELWTQGMTGADVTGGTANVWTLSTSGSQSSSSWTALTDISGSGASLTAGHGFLVYVYPDTDFDGDDDLPVTLKISGTYNSSAATYGSIPSGNYALAGNPFPHTIDWDNVAKTNVTTAYVWDDASSAYKSWNGSAGSLTNGLIAPLQGFLFLASGGTGSITMEAADKSTSAGTFYKILNDGSTGSVGFNIATADYTDQTFISFMNNGESGLDNADGYKLLPMSPSERVVGISYAEGNGLDISNLPYNHDGSISIPLDVMYLTVDDDYNFVTNENDVSMTWDVSSLPGHVSLTLTDNATGASVNLTEESEITFSTEAKGSFLSYGTGGVNIYPQVGESRFTLTVAYSALISNDEPANLPGSFALHPAYPNPFNPSTTISFDIPDATDRHTSAHVYDITGKLVETLINKSLPAGSHTITWNPDNLSSGLYIVQLKAGNKTFNQKLTFLK